MKKAELITVVVSKTIEHWKIASPQYKHDGKGPSLTKMYQPWNKKDLENRLNELERLLAE